MIVWVLSETCLPNMCVSLSPLQRLLFGYICSIWCIPSFVRDDGGYFHCICRLLCLQGTAQKCPLKHPPVSDVFLRHHASWPYPQQVFQGHQHRGRDSSARVWGLSQLFVQYRDYDPRHHHCHAHFLDRCSSSGCSLCSGAGEKLHIIREVL